ncbi:hypothetical protein [Butyrivibrio sp.]|uniref:hypothetical protein n=1 Tax=Butyrivibrio sp. TaxID=28121 RepID=UPI0025BE275D|nr:hypothetical protein [Butyrivibrio sp.]MBQ9302719.1 hypothetical protein [Butyrivibrio sp.]
MTNEQIFQKCLNRLIKLDKELEKTRRKSLILQTAKVSNMLSYATGCAPGQAHKEKDSAQIFRRGYVRQ